MALVYFFCTGPISRHCFWRSAIFSAVSFQSVLSFRASACSHRAVFFSRFAVISVLACLKNSPLRLKNASHAARKRSKIFWFCLAGAKPMSFHFFCRASTSWVLSFQLWKVVSLSYSIPSRSSQITVFWSRFSFSFSLSCSKCCWCRLFITVDAALNLFHISSLDSLDTGPVSRYS